MFAIVAEVRFKGGAKASTLNNLEMHSCMRKGSQGMDSAMQEQPHISLHLVVNS